MPRVEKNEQVLIILYYLPYEYEIKKMAMKKMKLRVSCAKKLREEQNQDQ